MDCIFCKIIRGEVPGLKVFEDEHSLVIMDIAGDIDGHMLAIPKKHCESIFDCSEENLSNLMKTVQLVAKHCVDCGFDGMNLLNANGKAAGQSVPHFHVHIIPRKAMDGIDAWPKFPGSKYALQEMHQKLKME